jgi:hypothetical protein
MNNSLVVNLYPSPTSEADERLVVSSAAVSLAATWTESKTKYLLIDVQGDDVMVTFDGSTPTATNGHLFKKATAPFFWNKTTARLAKFIRAASTDAAIQATPFTV